ncbi:MAG: DinB family protein [Actinomycetota bacterium]|nr:DinB family protein [Actinomycetota bacterium]
MILPLPDKEPHTPRVGDERELLTATVDYQRAVLLRKVGGLDEDDLRRVMTPSGLTLLGLVRHLAYVERYWFQVVFAGRDADLPWSDADPDADWHPEPGETAPEIVELYRAESAVARRIASESELDAMSAHKDVQVSMRWILLHMLEELARHLGHADLMREELDGATGD